MDLFSSSDQYDDVKERLGHWGNLYDSSSLELLSKTLEVVEKERENHIIYPHDRVVFRALHHVAPQQVKVVILGQDPYHDGNATGLAFGVNHTITPSLQKIFGAIRSQCEEKMEVKDATLHYWAVQGILLLNTCLTVRGGAPKSHSKIRWQDFVTDTLKIVNNNDNVVWMLWGTDAKNLGRKVINNSTHLVLEAEHPAYAAREGRDWKCDHFAKSNEFFEEKGIKKIFWI